MPELTQKQKDIHARQQQVSLKWMGRNLHRYRPDARVAGLMGQRMQSDKLEWTAENLDTVFDELVREGVIDEAEHLPDPHQPVRPTPLTVDRNSPPWQSPLTKAAVRAMSVGDMKRFLKDKRWSAQFEQEIQKLKITRGELR